MECYTVVVFINSWGLVNMNMTGTKTNTLDTLLTILIIIGIILAIKTIPATMNYDITYLKNLACSYESFFMGNIKTYTTCTTNALHIIWNALEATPKILTQELGW